MSALKRDCYATNTGPARIKKYLEAGGSPERMLQAGIFTPSDDFNPLLGIKAHYKHGGRILSEDATLLMLHLLIAEYKISKYDIEQLKYFATQGGFSSLADWITKFYLNPKPSIPNSDEKPAITKSSQPLEPEKLVSETEPEIPEPEPTQIQSAPPTQPTANMWERFGYALFYTIGTLSCALIVGCYCLIAYDLATRTPLSTPVKMVTGTNSTNPPLFQSNQTRVAPLLTKNQVSSCKVGY